MNNRPLLFTADHLLHILQSFPVVSAYMVGFSGGADSTALLHAIKTVQHELDLPVSAVHVNHGLHADADLWQQHCVEFCRQHEIELTCLKISPDINSGNGLEAEARHLRYQALENSLKPGSGLLTAHHSDDQAETLILNLMRGSGVDGLSGMPESRPLGKGVLQRPLLGFQTSTLKNYLHEAGIEWIEDPSNEYLNHDRNFVRHEIMPLLEKRWPQVNKRLLLTRKAMTDARILLERLADDYIAQHLPHPMVLLMESGLIDDPELFKLILRRWTKLSASATLPAYRLDTFYEQVRKAGNKQNVTICWGGWLVQLYGKRLWLHRDVMIQPCSSVNWVKMDMKVELGHDAGQLEFIDHHVTSEQLRDEPGLGKTLVPTGEFCVGSRTAMEETAIYHGGHHRSLKSLFQAARIPPWLRDCIPVCNWNGELVAMGDWYCSESFENWLRKNGVTLNWRPRNPLLEYIHAQQKPRAVDPAGAVR